ncbi:molybdenum cofactor guanylyltransferase [Streptomyces populi]|uniref:Molybdenum cofactor guanylyltransferase n=1 Tax=Streptomyces populi TaxID=2058924 RepID=A0A2I0SAU0_9ACTN|nr:NTP transferase domain-containing protein [Streptomyces populi]PKT67045.1 molybdenum cofactor guanylyltransferase [Streptomyces populi]
MTAYEPEGATGRPDSRDPRGTSGAGAGCADAGYDAVVLAGGAARRLGGEDKPGVRVGGRKLLDRVLAACADATRTVVVADPRSTARPVEWAREDPPGGGPLAALEAGLRHTAAPYVLVLSADLPFLEEKTVRRLLDTLRSGGGAHGIPPAPEALHQTPDEPAAHDDGRATGSGGRGARPDGVLLTDSGGRDQPLVAVYRADALRRELAVLAAAHGGLAGLPLRRLVAALDLTRITDPVASFDCDTWDDIAAARTRIREHGHVLDEWISAVKDELGIDLDVDTGVLLDLARDAAHGVARPAAPLTTFLVGYAAARAGGGPEAVAEAARKAAALALRWAEEDASDARPDAAPPAAGPDAG